MSLFKQKIESYVGVDIGAQSMKVVELRRTKGRPQLWSYGLADLPEFDPAPFAADGILPTVQNTESNVRPTDAAAAWELEFSDERADHYGELLSELMERSHIVGKRVASSLPVSQVFHTIINLPAVSEKEIDHMVKSEIAKVLPRPEDEMQIVYQAVPLSEEMKKNYTRLLVTAAPKKVVGFYSRIFAKAGLSLEELETEAFALARALVGKDESLTMLVAIGATRTNFSLVDKGLPMTERGLQIGGETLDAVIAERLGVTPKEAAMFKHDLVNSPLTIGAEPFMRFLEPIAKEIQHNFDTYLSQTGNEGRKPEKIVLTGGGAEFPVIAEYLKKQFPMRVFVGDPWARILHQDALRPILHEIAPRLATALGLALRNF